MEPNGNDVLIEEIDKELRAIDTGLKKVLSKTEILLKELTNEPNEAEMIGIRSKTLIFYKINPPLAYRNFSSF